MPTKHQQLLTRWGVPLALFLLALLVRVPTLGEFTTFDESRWINRSRWFLIGLLFPEQECPPVEWGREVAAHGLACTFQIGYPGATTMWAGSLGLLLYYRQTAGAEVELQTFLQSLPIYRLEPGVIAPTRLPLTVAGALFVPFFYGLGRRLLDERAALLAALLTALHPFHIALSRILHHDALNTTFMVLAALALAGYWLRDWSWPWLLLSAVMAGLAFLSKQVSWFLIPYVGALAGWTLIYRRRQSLAGTDSAAGSFSFWPAVGRLAGEGVAWGAAAGLTMIALFPAMWVMPVEVLRTIFSASSALAGEGQTHYFLGEVSTDPGPLFYPVGWLLRATPFEVVGLLSVGVAAGLGLARQKTQLLWRRPVEVALVLFVGLFWLFLSMSDKKFVRYALPAFPIIDLFAALGLLWLLRRLNRFWPATGRLRLTAVGLLAGFILLGQGWLVFAHYPYYLTYHNPLLGGSTGAAPLMTIIGWGEGLPEAADYLNRQPEAESLQVVAERFCSMLRPFFVGQVSCLNSTVGGILQADYLVYYYNLLQRDLQWPEQWRYFQQHHAPVHRVTLHGLDYVLIYRNPIDHLVDRESHKQPGLLTAFGYNLSNAGQLTLFWQNEGLGSQPLWVALTPAEGVQPVSDAVDQAGRKWFPCSLVPAFIPEAETPKAILESRCLLDAAALSPGLYTLHLGRGQSGAISPLETGRLAIVAVNRAGRFEPVDNN